MELCATVFRGRNNYNLYEGIAYSLDLQQLIEKELFLSKINQGAVEGAMVATTPITDLGSCSLGPTSDSFSAEVFSIGAGSQIVAVAPLPRFEREDQS